MGQARETLAREVLSHGIQRSTSLRSLSIQVDRCLALDVHMYGTLTAHAIQRQGLAYIALFLKVAFFLMQIGEPRYALDFTKND